MRIDFNSSEGPSLGIEVELELVDKHTRDLTSAATAILAELGEPHGDGGHPKAKHELFESCIEIITGVCQTVPEARADLEGTLAEVRGAAEARGLEVCCSGTHPFARWADQVVSPNPRYRKLIEEMAWMAQRLQIFGVHVHVGVKSPEKAIAIANACAAYIPHLLALSASSPYWMGHDTGLASCRSKVFEGLPTAGLPEPIESWESFETFMETLVSSEAIGTIREVWWDIRPHPDFGTIELRMCDGLSSMSEVAAVAALAQSLVTRLDSLVDEGFTLPSPKEWILRQNKWRAARHGLDAELVVDEQGTRRPVRDALADLVDDLSPTARKLGCSDELASVADIVSKGASYQRQREVVASGGTLVDVVDHLVAEMRQ